MRRLAVGLGLLLAATPAVAQDRARVDLYDAESRRQGYVIVDRERGRIDTFDKYSNRTGYGVVQPDGRVDRYRLDGTRAGSAVRESARPRR